MMDAKLEGAGDFQCENCISKYLSQDWKRTMQINSQSKKRKRIGQRNSEVKWEKERRGSHILQPSTFFSPLTPLTNLPQSIFCFLGLLPFFASLILTRHNRGTMGQNNQESRPLTHSLAPYCSLCPHPLLLSFFRLLTHYWPCGKVNHCVSQN